MSAPRRPERPDPLAPAAGQVTATVEADPDGAEVLRRHIRDLAALLALPAMWRGHEPGEIAGGLADVLFSLLRLDLALVQLGDPTGGPAIEVWRPPTPKRPLALGRTLDAGLAPGEMTVTVSAPESADGGAIRVTALALEPAGDGGRVLAGSRRPDFPTALESFLLRVAVDQAAIAIEGARLLGRERAVRAEAEMLLHIGRVLSAELDLEKLVQAVTDAATRFSGAQFGAFFYNVVNEQGEAYMLYSLSGAPREAFERFPMPRNTAVFGPTFRGEEVVRLDDVTADPRYGQNAPHHGMPAGHLPVRSYLAAPVVSRTGEVLGGLFFGHSEVGVFTERAERLVVGIAAQAATAIDNARLYQQVQEAVRTRDEFLAVAAHDLKTPLTAIKGLAQLLRRQAARPGGAGAERLVEGLASVDATATQMAGQIDELLDLARLQMGQPLELHREPTDLVALARRVAAEQQRTTERHRLGVEAAAPEIIGAWDAVRLARALNNLLSNAIKYSPDGGDISVTVAREDAGGAAWAVVAVRDRGLGIPAADLARIFERFQRAGNVAGRIDGTGIGLASARQLVELHGGTIDAASREGEGSTFTIRLPLTAATGSAPGPPAGEGAAASP